MFYGPKSKLKISDYLVRSDIFSYQFSSQRPASPLAKIEIDVLRR